MPSRPEDGRPRAAPSPPPATDDQAAPGTGRSACVLYHAPGSIAPPALVASLQRHGATVCTCTDPYAMLAHACRLTGGTGPRKSAAVLVVVEPGSLRRVVELAHALRRYVPRSALWYFEEASNPKLRAVTATEIAAWSPRPTPAEALAATIRTGAPGGLGTGGPANPWTPARPLKPALRLTEPIEPSTPAAQGPGAGAGTGHASAALRANAAGGEGAEEALRSRPGGPLLSAEELAMLLGDGGDGSDEGAEDLHGHEGLAFDDPLDPSDDEPGEGRHA